MRVIKKIARALAGFSQMFSTELSLKIEVFFGLAVLAAAYFFRVTRFEFLFLTGAVFGILILEGINTALERVVDLAQPRYHEAAKEIKDALAAVVMLAVVASAVVGVVIFWPYLHPGA